MIVIGALKSPRTWSSFVILNSTFADGFGVGAGAGLGAGMGVGITACFSCSPVSSLFDANSYYPLSNAVDTIISPRRENTAIAVVTPK